MTTKTDRHYQLLELEPGASMAEVELAYRRLLRRYEAGCLPSYGLLRVKERNKLLDALKSAYDQLKRAATPLGGGGAPQGGGGHEMPEEPSAHPTQSAEHRDEGAELAMVQVGVGAHTADAASIAKKLQAARSL